MQSFRSIKKTQLTILNLLFAVGLASANPIGDITESKGIGTITRNNESVGNSVGTEILLKDEAQTGNGRMKIVFLDDEVLDMTENTYAYIDEVYYDPDPNLSRMSLNMVQGTARFTSGLGNRIKKKNIKVNTPAAQITINGTDFTTTVDEIGRSLVILLPDDDGNASGEIVVTNDGGSVTLNQAYQATMVNSFDSPPASSVTLANITPNMIDNMFIVNPPEEVRDQMEDAYRDEQDQDQGILDVDFLEFNELETDALADTGELEFSELDIDFLDVDFLVDLLDVVEELERTTVTLADVQETAGTGAVQLQGGQIGFNKDSQFNIFVQDGDLYFYRSVAGTIEIVVVNGTSRSGFIDLNIDGYVGLLQFGTDPSIEIYINQNN
tara:strand:+ start:11501 stop:12646 length:1146 start_codon:yes stop_codon:yes gene_type:complete